MGKQQKDLVTTMEVIWKRTSREEGEEVPRPPGKDKTELDKDKNTRRLMMKELWFFLSLS